jgi:hypothetical protein
MNILCVAICLGSGDASSPESGCDALVAILQTLEVQGCQPATKASPALFCNEASQLRAGWLPHFGLQEAFS